MTIHTRYSPKSAWGMELTQQLRGKSDDRQVEGVRVALAHNVGLCGAGVVTVYKSI
ncbi:hypothetical protein [Paraburkholderia sacchari]|uniref:hypothetical protein n=1 Tax=Paraburkholderia sacchari TaxID=159450 RepID=UPI0026CD72F1